MPDRLNARTLCPYLNPLNYNIRGAIMQDKYAGDVGDFGKFSLLKNLFRNLKYKIGVI